MNIDRAIVSTDDNPEYYKFWPVVARRWLSWGITPTLAAISDEKLDIDESLGEVVYIPPLEGVPTSHMAQISRIFMAASFGEDVCLVSDMDMMPLKKEYFVDTVKPYDNDAFIVYSADAYQPGNPAYPAYPMCYLCSTSNNFKQIIDGDLNNFNEKVREWMAHGFGWYTDEKVFYKKLTIWEKEKHQAVFLSRGFNISSHPLTIGRVDRSCNSEYSPKLLENNFYIDFHMPRPYCAYKDVIDEIYLKTTRGED